MMSVTLEKIAICYAEGFTGMTVMQELAIQATRLPFKQYVAIVDQTRQAEAKDISGMHELFRVKHYNSKDPESIGEFLEGVDMVLVIPPAQRNKVQCTKFIIDKCQQSGVNAVVMVSSIGAECNDKPLLRDFDEIEKSLKNANFSKTAIVRCGFYMQNLLLYSEQIKQGVLPLPLGDGSMKMIDLADIGEGLVKVIEKLHAAEQPFHHVYTFAGEKEFSGKELAETMSSCLPNKVEWKDISMEEAETILKKTNVIDPYEADYLLNIYQLVHEKRILFQEDDYYDLLNTNPTKFREFVNNYYSEMVGTTKEE